MGQTNSNPVRPYSRFILMLKIIQFFGYFVVVLFSLIFSFFAGGIFLGGSSPLALVPFLLQASIGCGTIYVITQGLIAIVDLLSRIEQNTRP